MSANAPSLLEMLTSAHRHLGKGDLAAAAKLFEKIVAKAPNHAEALFYLGSLAAQAGDLANATVILRKALAVDPANPQSHNNLGIVLEQQGRYDEAVGAYRQSLAFAPANAEANNNLGDLLSKQGEPDQAVKYFKEALRLKPGYVQAMNNLAIALQATGHWPEAETYLRRAIELRPDYIKAYCNLGALLHKQDRFADAETVLAQALARQPDYPEVLNNLGIALAKLGRAAEGQGHIRRAIGLRPDYAEAYSNLGFACQELGRAEEAITLHDKALTLDPDLVAAKWQRAFAYLAKGDYGRGWPDYEAGLIAGERGTRQFPFPRWKGEPLGGKTILVHAEQGVGDEIMFASCAPELIAVAGQCIIECERRLAPLYKRSFPEAIIHGGSQNDELRWLADLPQVDYVVPVGSLPLFFRQSLGDFPRSNAYLKADPVRISTWRERYAALGDGLKVGVSWRGGKRVDPIKRSTSVLHWANVLSVARCQFVNLQYGECAADLQIVSEQLGVTIHHWPDTDPLSELDDFAAQVAALDLVISVSNATVHIAGSLGVPTWNLLAHVPSWRWTLQGGTTPWYPSVRLYRQVEPGAWDEVLARVAQDLAEKIQ